MNPPPWGDWREGPDFGLAHAAWVLGWLDPQEATWVAAAVLDQGFDTHEIRVTAGMINPERWRDGETIDLAFRQIQGGGLDWAAATTRIVQYQLARVLSGDEETLWEAVSTGAWIDLDAWDRDTSLLPLTIKKWAEHLRDIKYAIDDINEWSGPSAPRKRSKDGEKWRKKTWKELRQWAKREYESSDRK